MDFQPFRLVYGLMLILMLFVPFGVYHSISEPYIIGHLWGYHLPVGYIGLLSGSMVILHPKLFGNLRFGSVMIFIGLFLTLSLYCFPKDYFVNLLHNTSFNGNQIDIDYSIGNSTVLGLSFVNIIAGFLLNTKRKK